MSSPIETEPPVADAPATARAANRLQELEHALLRAREERAAQAATVDAELRRLSSIYDRLRSDLEIAREERDRALDDARREREQRARETLELSERLEEALAQDRLSDAESAARMRERFVEERLAAAPREHRRLEPGEIPVVPGFEIVELLGRGGMASVFHARRCEIGDDVALKILHGDLASSQSRTELFLREAAMMLQLDHPGLLRALDAGECEYGLYLVLPLVMGHSLSARVRREGPLDEGTAIRVALDIGRALRYCARAGLTHRDVKPSNILEDGEGRVLLCDFGLAALHTGDTGKPYGSPGFAAPEQLATPDQVDERADIYALGCTLWHLVVGRRAFPGGPQQSFKQARESDLPDPRIEGADISPRLAQVIRRMGRSRRSRRYRSWDECLLDLMLVEKGNPPLAALLSDALADDEQAPISEPVAAATGSVPPAPDAPAAPAPAPSAAEPRAAAPRSPEADLVASIQATADAPAPEVPIAARTTHSVPLARTAGLTPQAVALIAGIAAALGGLLGAWLTG